MVHVDNALAHRSAITLRDLRGETFCFIRRALAPAYHDLVTQAIRACGEDFPTWEHPLPGLRVAPLHDDGTGFTLVSASAGARLGPGLIALPLLDDLPMVDVRIAWRAPAPSPPAQLVLDAADDLACTERWR